MKKLLPVVLVVAVVAVVGVGAFMVMGQKKGDTSSDESVSDSSSSASDTFTGSLADAVKLGVGMKCTYKVAGNEYEGYIKGKNYRGKVQTAEGKVGEVIMKDNCMWSWSSEESQGIKTCFEDTDTEEGNIWEGTQGAAAAANMTYTCVPAAVTEAKFAPPSDINFMNLDEMMRGMGN